MSTYVDAVAHGFSADDPIVFSNLEGGQGIIEGQVYYVIASGLTADIFQFSETVGGAAFAFDTDITSGDVAAWPTYSVASDTIQDPPTTPETPTDPTLSSASISGVVRLTIDLTDTPAATVRSYEVSVTHKYSGSTPQWDGADIRVVQPTTTSITLPALPTQKYGVRVRALDVFGNYSSFSNVIEHTTVAGFDAVIASLADEAAALDHPITTTEIADDSISTPKLQANAVTADKIAANSVTVGKLAQNGANLVPNPSFELAPPEGFEVSGIAAPYGWDGATAACVGQYTSAYARTGTHVLRIQGDGVHTFPSANVVIPVRPGMTYRLSGWLAKVSGTGNAKTRIDSLDASKATVTTFVSNLAGTSGAITFSESTAFTCPTDGSVSYVRLYCYIDKAAADAGDVCVFEDIELLELPPGARNTDGSVLINSDGITIQSGKLTFKDPSGATALDQYGFGANWLDFLNRLLYNGSFQSGSTTSIAANEVSGADSIADYQASITASLASSGGVLTNLPYWVIPTQTALLKIVADASAVGGFALQSSAQTAAGMKSRIYQDAPVRPGHAYRAQWNWKVTADASHDIQFNIYASYRDSTHAIIGSVVASGLVYATSFGYTVQSLDLAALGEAPSNAAYIRVEWEIVHNASSTSVVKLSDLTILDGGKPPKVTVFTANGTYTKSAGLRYIVVEVIGGGGGGGGAATTAAATSATAGGGGGGGYARKIIEAQDVSPTPTIAVGAAGSGGSAGANDGGTGGTSSYLDTMNFIQATGGSGGAGRTAGTDNTGQGGSGGTASGGDINIPGNDGGHGLTRNGLTLYGGSGGAAGGGLSASTTMPFVSSNGFAGSQYGGGGSGAVNGNSQGTARSGGAGAKGAVIITEYFE